MILTICFLTSSLTKCLCDFAGNTGNSILTRVPSVKCIDCHMSKIGYHSD